MADFLLVETESDFLSTGCTPFGRVDVIFDSCSPIRDFFVTSLLLALFKLLLPRVKPFVVLTHVAFYNYIILYIII